MQCGYNYSCCVWACVNSILQDRFRRNVENTLYGLWVKQICNKKTAVQILTTRWERDPKRTRNSNSKYKIPFIGRICLMWIPFVTSIRSKHVIQCSTMARRISRSFSVTLGVIVCFKIKACILLLLKTRSFSNPTTSNQRDSCMDNNDSRAIKKVPMVYITYSQNFIDYFSEIIET